MMQLEEYAKPFFVLDWLDELMEDQDAFKIAELLRTPSKSASGDDDYASYIHQGDEPYMQRCISNIEVSPAISSSTPKLTNCKRASSQSLPPSIPPQRFFADDTTTSTAGTADSPPAMPPKRLFSGDTATTTSSTTGSNTFQQKRAAALGNGWNAKGLTKAKLGQWKQALACWDKALEIRQQMASPSSRKDALEVANTWNNRGIAQGKLGQFDKAMFSLHRAYEIRCSQLGSNHSQVISTLHNIANVHQQQGNLTLALEVFGNAKNRLLSNSKDDSAKNPMLVARICTAIGHVYYQAQQWVDSKDAYQDALNLLLLHVPSNKNESNSVTKQQREIYELQRDIQELDAKIKASSLPGSFTNTNASTTLGQPLY
eukprot:scaffold1813_cov109-Cylindrotheca_fusiformis.AAC.7